MCSRNFLLLRLKENQIEIEKEVTLLRTEQNICKGISLLINRDTSCPGSVYTKNKMYCVALEMMSGFCIRDIYSKP